MPVNPKLGDRAGGRDPGLTKAAASKRIDVLRVKTHKPNHPSSTRPRS